MGFHTVLMGFNEHIDLERLWNGRPITFKKECPFGRGLQGSVTCIRRDECYVMTLSIIIPEDYVLLMKLD